MTGKGPKPGTSGSHGDQIKEDTSKVSAKPGPQYVQYMYPSEDKSSHILSLLNATRQTGEFCDIQIKLSPVSKIYAHKAILSACSPYFKLMFTSTFMEAISDEIDLSHVTEDTEIVENVINTFYGQRFEIDADNVVEVMYLANMFLMEDLREWCAGLLKKIIGLQNAAEMLQLSFSFDMQDLRRLASPILEARFHDYIMFQEDLVDMGADCFEYLLSIQRHSISRKADYVRLVCRWFKRSVNDERAEVAVKALSNYRRFVMSEHTYKEVETDVIQLLNDLGEVESELSPETRQRLIQVIKDLKPADFDSSISYESDLEESRDLEIHFPQNMKVKMIGPRVEEEGYTAAEVEEWAQHRVDVEEYEKLDAEWKQHLAKRKESGKRTLLTEEDPEGTAIRKKMNPILRRHQTSYFQFKTRKLRVKTPAELELEARLLDMVVVLAPGREHLENGVDDTMVIVGYVPRKKSWYKLGTLRARDICRSRPMHTPLRYSSMDEDEWSTDYMRDPIFRETMMDERMLPEMRMYLEDMPAKYRHRFLKQMTRGMPPRMMHQMMMDGDMSFHRMMMRDNMMGAMRDNMMGAMRPPQKSSVNSLFQGKWKMACLNLTLYFYSKEENGRVWSYDIVGHDWKEHSVSTQCKNREPSTFTTDEDLELIVMGQTLYAVVTFALLDTRNDFWTSRSRSESDTRTIKTKFLISKLIGNEKFEEFYETESHDMYLDKNQFEKQDPQPETSRYPLETTTLMLRGVMKTVLFAEDDEKLLIFPMQRVGTQQAGFTFRPSYILAVYLDDPSDEKNMCAPYNHNFLRELTPLVHDDVLALLNDEMEVVSVIDLAKPEDVTRDTELGSSHPEDVSRVLEGQKTYPLCPFVTAHNGRFEWVIEGAENDITKLLEVRPRAHQTYMSRKVGKKQGVPPPLRCFTLACASRIDRHVLRRYNPPTKYLHV